MKYILISLSLLLSVTAFSQSDIPSLSHHSQVKIDLEGRETAELAKLGLSFCGADLAQGRFLINIFNQYELSKIKDAGFKYDMLIEDMNAFYQDRLDNPNAYAGHTEHVHTRGIGCTEEVSLIENIETPINYGSGTMQGYFTLAEAYASFDKMQSLYPELITVKTPIGIKTHEDNDIFYIKISDNPNMDETEPELLYNSITHAREPGSLTQLIFYMWYLLENYETIDEVKYLVDNTEMFFVPVINPDGYLYNERIAPNGGGLWRKNRYVNELGDTVGVDLNRNFGFEWGFDDVGSSINELDNTYRGVAPFSEPETQAIRKLCMEHEFIMAMNYHTFGNLLIHPWGYNDTPTDEDDIFKAFGKIMTEHNDYKIGTGIETVGYNVNGDIDDYLYGDTIDKKKIYSMTPEVGPAFWAQEVNIDDINKYALRENLNTAHLTLNYGRTEEVNPEIEIAGANGSFDILFTHYGLQSGAHTLKVVSLNPALQFDNTDFDFDLSLLETETFNVTYSLDESLLLDKEQIEFEIQIDNGLVVIKDGYSKTYRTEIIPPEIVFENDNSSLEDYTSNGDWGLTDEDFVSGPDCITDSPYDRYGRNLNTQIIYTLPLDLSNAEEAFIRFWAKWDIEDGFDYVQFQATNEQGTFEGVCGLYTDTGTEFQDEGEPLYDGQQLDWVYERLSLESLVGLNAVTFRFRFYSDMFSGGDGFYFDDFSLEVINKGVSSIKDLDGFFINVSPNPSHDAFNIGLDPNHLTAEMKIEVYDLQGKMVYEAQELSTKNRIDLSQYTAGIYTMRLLENGTEITSQKLIKL